MAKAKDPFKKKKATPKVSKLKTSDLIDTKALAKQTKNSVTAEHVAELNRKFKEKHGEQLLNINKHTIPAKAATENGVDGFIVPTITSWEIDAILRNAIVDDNRRKFDDNGNEIVAEIEHSEVFAPARKFRLEVAFKSSVVLASLSNDILFTLYISQVATAMLNQLVREIEFGPSDVPYYGGHYLSFTAESEEPFVLGECNEVRLVLSANVAKAPAKE